MKKRQPSANLIDKKTWLITGILTLLIATFLITVSVTTLKNSPLIKGAIGKLYSTSSATGYGYGEDCTSDDECPACLKCELDDSSSDDYETCVNQEDTTEDTNCPDSDKQICYKGECEVCAIKDEGGDDEEHVGCDACNQCGDDNACSEYTDKGGEDENCEDDDEQVCDGDGECVTCAIKDEDGENEEHVGCEDGSENYCLESSDDSSNNVCKECLGYDDCPSYAPFCHETDNYCYSITCEISLAPDFEMIWTTGLMEISGPLSAPPLPNTINFTILISNSSEDLDSTNTEIIENEDGEEREVKCDPDDEVSRVEGACDMDVLYWCPVIDV